MHRLVVHVGVNADELRHESLATQTAELRHEAVRRMRHAQHIAVQKHNERVGLVQLGAREQIDIFETECVAQTHDRCFVDVRRDMRHQCQILDQTARFTLGRVGRT